MTVYVLRRTIGGYVTWPGSARSYTRNVLDARWFATREEAERNRCPDNEHVVLITL
jgi:hypothetical protein